MTNEIFLRYFAELIASAKGDTADDVEFVEESDGGTVVMVGDTTVLLQHQPDTSSLLIKMEMGPLEPDMLGTFCQLAMSQAAAWDGMGRPHWAVDEEGEVVASLLIPLQVLEPDVPFFDLLETIADNVFDVFMDLCMDVTLVVARDAGDRNVGGKAAPVFAEGDAMRSDTSFLNLRV